MEKTLAREMRLIKWATDLQEAEASGLSHKQWCQLNNISYSTFKYRVNMVNLELKQRKETSDTVALVPQFAEVPASSYHEPKAVEVSDDNLIYVELNNAKIKFPVSSTLEQMKVVLEVLTNA